MTEIKSYHQNSVAERPLSRSERGVSGFLPPSQATEAVRLRMTSYYNHARNSAGDFQIGRY